MIQVKIYAYTDVHIYTYKYIDVHDRILLVGEAGPIDANGNDQKC